MHDEHRFTRWLVVVGAVLAMMSFGSFLAWGAYTKALQDPAGAFRFTAAQTQSIYSTGLAMFALSMVVAGRLQDKYGPRRVALIGGLVLGAAYIAAGLSGPSYWLLVLFIGVFGGIGVGTGYVCPIAVCVRWFPEMKGVMTGVAIAGIGAGSFLFLQMAGPWLHLVARYGVSGTFVIFGVLFSTTVVVGAMLLSMPPEGWRPKGWNPVSPEGTAPRAVADLTQSQTIQTYQFWLIWLAFMLGTGCGLMVIGNLRDYALQERQYSEAVGSWLVGMLALFNGMGRIFWGALSERLSAKRAAVWMFLLQAPVLFVLARGEMPLIVFFAAACWVGVSFGATLTLFPLLTVDNFGARNVGQNYGAVYTGYGIGGIVGPIMAGHIWDTQHSYALAFNIAGVACLVAAALLYVKKPVMAVALDEVG